MTTTFDDVEAVGAATGRDLGTTAWQVISQDRIRAFADVTGDHQWIHVDDSARDEGPFGGTVAHGAFTLSLAASAATLAEHMQVEHSTFAVGLLGDDMRAALAARRRGEIATFGRAG